MKAAIVGAGISGLATAHAILEREPDADLRVFESGSRAGGKVITEKTGEGYLCEWGVNGFLDKSPPTLELARKLGLDAMPADLSAKRRFVFSEGGLHKLPEKPPEFFTSRLLSVGGRLRVVGEVFSGKSRKDDESLEEFGTRHLGREAFEKLIDPMASGVFAGDARHMSLKSCFPRMRELEDDYGSLIRALISLQKAARKSGSKNKPGPSPGGTLTSFEDGMAAMTDAISLELGDRLRLGCGVERIEHDGKAWRLALEDGTEQRFEAVVLACPAYAQSAMLSGFDEDLAEWVGGIAYPALSVVCLGYDRSDLGDEMDGFGFLVPSREQREILGTVADSYVFPNRAPEGKVLLRTMVGGARSPERASYADERLLDVVRSNLRDIMGVDADPEFAKVYRHQRAIPQYLVGHAKRLAAIEKRLESHAGLYMSGNAFRGVSLNDCIVNARNVAEEVLAKKRPA